LATFFTQKHAVVGSSRHHSAALISWKQLAAFSGIQQSAAAVSGIFMRTQCSAAVSSSKHSAVFTSQQYSPVSSQQSSAISNQQSSAISSIQQLPTFGSSLDQSAASTQIQSSQHNL
jgi:hypothetical protein